jgi:ABC-type glycerol-3-phosphate transport system substrate-binding protein
MKRLIWIGVMLVFGLPLAFARGGAAGGSSSSRGTGRDANGNLTYKGTITMYAQNYNPVPATLTNPYPPKAFADVAKKWEDLHPGIKIEFITDLGEQDFTTWISTKIAGGQAPDVFWSLYFFLTNGTVPMGAFYELNDVFERPNHYIAGNARWLDTFNPSFVEQTRGTKGEIFNVVADYVTTLVFYNKEIFRRAGIDFEIKTWTDYTKACQMIKAIGVTPWINGIQLDWYAWLFGTNLYYDDFAKLAVISGPDALALSPVEVAIAIKNGYFSDRDPRWTVWWDCIKDHLDNYMPRDALTTSGEAMLNMFLNQQVAMRWDGSWGDNTLRAANIGFEYGTFPMPIPDPQSMRGATRFDSSPAIGGPSGSFQYAISTPRANNSMTSEKYEAIVDWMMYITTPENDEYIVNDLGSFIPSIKGTKPAGAMSNLAHLVDAESKKIEIGTSVVGPQAQQIYQSEFQLYLTGHQTKEQALRNIMPEFIRAADQIIAESGIDVSRYLINN